jgi:hypothetical protein
LDNNAVTGRGQETKVGVVLVEVRVGEKLAQEIEVEGIAVRAPSALMGAEDSQTEEESVVDRPSETWAACSSLLGPSIEM